MATQKSKRVRLLAPWPLDPKLCMNNPYWWPYAQPWQELMGRVDWPAVADYETLTAPGSLMTPLPLRFHADPPRSRREDMDLRRSRRARNLTAVEEYVGTVIESRSVPSRVHNWHDLLNMLTWLSFPRAKWALFQLFYDAMQAMPLATHRVRPRLNDRITCFDEGGILLVTSQTHAAQAIELVSTADLDAKAALLRQGLALGFIFGHGLWECLLAGKNDITSLAVLVSLADDDFKRARAERFADTALIDQALADYLSHPSQGFAAGYASGSFPVRHLLTKGMLTHQGSLG